MNTDFTMDEMLMEIKYRLASRIPTSIVRYGDGEAIVLNGFNDIPSFNKVLRNHTGKVPRASESVEIRSNLIWAYRGADIIGVPVKNRFMDEPGSYWAMAEGLLRETVGDDVLSKKKFTNIDVHAHFLNKGYYHELLAGRDTLCYISCRNLDKQFKDRFGITNVYSYIIAPEMKFTSGWTGPDHYPDQFNDIQKWMKTIPVNGNLCLVGAGWIGKIYNNWFRDNGGISFDIGSVFDSWAGRVTRGTKRGLDVVEMTHKL